jgi:Flp pilus assembly protein TadG
MARADGRQPPHPVHHDQRGNVALIVALTLPLLLLVGLGAIELSQVLTDNRATQNTADAAALMGATQLSIAPSGAAQRAQAFAEAQLGPIAAHATVSVAASVSSDQTSVTVTVDTQRPSFFGDVLPPGGFHTHVSATAKAANTAPLCVLTTGTSQTSLPVVGGLVSSDQLDINATGVMQAGACLVHSQSALNSLGLLQASASEAVGQATGIIVPAAETGAAPITDPFAGVDVDLPAGTSCAANAAPDMTLTDGGTTVLPAYSLGAQLHGNITVSGDTTLSLAPGIHYFCGALSLAGNGKLTGDGVALVFAPGSEADFGVKGLVKMIIPGSNKTRVSLTGLQSGPLAGFVIVANRQYTSNFVLDGDAITNLTGAVYVPNAPLFVQGSGLANQAAPWTVITALDMELTSGTLVINANYAASTVPVPTGVGNHRSQADVELTQ